MIPFDAAPPVDAAARDAAQVLLDRLTKPPGSLGRLESLAVWAAGVQQRCPPMPFDRVSLVIVAGDHGVARQAGTSAYPPEVTAQMVANFLAGGAAANVLAERSGVAVRVVDASVDSDYPGLAVPQEVRATRIRRGSGSIDREDALTREEVEASLTLGGSIADSEIDAGTELLVVGDMGIGNTTPAAAIVAMQTGSDVVAVTGRGTGIDDATWMRKATAIRDALWRARGHAPDPVTVLQRVGGADLGTMAGLLARAGQRRTPVLLDGSVVTAAALLAAELVEGATRWWVAGHRSAEPAHTIALQALDLEPILDLGMRLGEGSGALTALPVLQRAIALIGGMATFASAGVSQSPAGDG